MTRRRQGHLPSVNASLAHQIQALQTRSARQKYQYLLDQQQPEELVQALPAQDLYLLLKELGPLDVPELVGLASGAQLTCCIDLDCWRGDQFDSRQGWLWLELLAQQDEQQQLRLLEEMDFDALVLLLKGHLHIVHGLEAWDEDNNDAPPQRPGQIYECRYAGEEQARLLEGLQDLLFRERRSFFLQLMEAVRHETRLTLTEEVYQLRSGRLGDLGFYEPVEARLLRAWLDPASFRPQDFDKTADPLWSRQTALPEAPLFILTAARPQDLLAEVLSGGLTPALHSELALLLNRAMSADQVDVGDPVAVRQSLEDVYHYLNIALGHLAGSAADTATELFGRLYLQSLYRLGFCLTERLARQARSLRRSCLGPWFDPPAMALLTALDQPKPRLYAALIDPVHADMRPFTTCSQLQLVQRELDTLQALQQLFSRQPPFALPVPTEWDLCDCQPPQANEVGLAQLFLTALANRLLGEAFAPVPLALVALEPLHQRLTASAGAFEALWQQSRQQFEQQQPGTGVFVDYAFRLLQQEFCPLAPADLKPAFITAFVLRLS